MGVNTKENTVREDHTTRIEAIYKVSLSLGYTCAPVVVVVVLCFVHPLDSII